MVAHEEPQQDPVRRARCARPAVAVRLTALGAVAALLLGACTGNVTTPGEALRILGTTLPKAYVAEPYSETVQAAGGLRPYDFALAGGSLPPGLELQGGAIRGTPTTTGDYTFTVKVSDANLSTTVQQYTMTVDKLPPPTLDFNVPDTQVDHPTTLHVQLANGRRLEGVRTQVRWDTSSFALVPDSVKASRPGLALLHKASDGELQVAVVPLGTRIDGQVDLFEFQLQPVAGAARLSISAQTEYISANGHAFDSIGEASSGASSGSGGSPAAGTGSGGAQQSGGSTSQQAPPASGGSASGAAGTTTDQNGSTP